MKVTARDVRKLITMTDLKIKTFGDGFNISRPKHGYVKLHYMRYGDVTDKKNTWEVDVYQRTARGGNRWLHHKNTPGNYRFATLEEAMQYAETELAVLKSQATLTAGAKPVTERPFLDGGVIGVRDYHLPASWFPEKDRVWHSTKRKIQAATGVTSSVIRQASLVGVVILEGQKVIFDPDKVNKPDQDEELWFLFDCKGHVGGATFNLIYDGQKKFIPVDRRTLKTTGNTKPKRSVDLTELTVIDQKLLDDVIAASV
jgi:hypothetical protein